VAPISCYTATGSALVYEVETGKLPDHVGRGQPGRLGVLVVEQELLGVETGSRRVPVRRSPGGTATMPTGLLPQALPTAARRPGADRAAISP
jgi:hypothetical protein